MQKNCERYQYIAVYVKVICWWLPGYFFLNTVNIQIKSVTFKNYTCTESFDIFSHEVARGKPFISFTETEKL